MASITLKEKYDYKALLFLVTNDDFAQEYPRIHAGLQRLLSQDAACYDVTYATGSEGIGRFTSSTSVPGFAFPAVYMKRLPRTLLFHKNCDDTDFECCHQSLLVQYCHKHLKVSCPAIEYYVTNKQAVRQEVAGKLGITVEQAKELVNRVTYGGRISTWCALPEFQGRFKDSDVPEVVHRMRQEVESIMPGIMERHPDVVPYARKKLQEKLHAPPTPRQLSRSVMAYVLQTIERECVAVLVELVEAAGFEVCAIIYDGIMTYKRADGVCPSSYYQAWSDGILERTGYQLGIALKPMVPSKPLLEQHESTLGQLQSLIRESVSFPTDGNIAAIVHHMLGEQYVMPDKDMCFYFDANTTHWVRDPKATHFRAVLRRVVLPIFTRACKNLGADLELEEDGEKQDYLNLQADVFRRKIIPKLDDSGKIGGILSQYNVMSMESHKGFMDKLDGNPHLLGFMNGVYDFKACSFREGRRDDYVSMSVPHQYPETSNAEIRADLQAFLSSLFDSEEQLVYVLRVLAQSLSGDTSAQHYYIFHGSGSNGKSLLMGLLKDCLGNSTASATAGSPRGYFYRAPEGFCMGKGSSANGATPAEFGIKGAQIVNIVEPNGTFNNTMLKALSGGDQVTARELYGPLQTFKPRATIFICCNDIPNIPNAGTADLRRIRVIPFPHNFVDNPTLSHQRQIDRSLESKFASDGRYCQEFLLMLLETYQRDDLGKQAIPTPAEVLDYSKSVVHDNNPVAEAINAGVEAGVFERAGPDSWVPEFEFHRFVLDYQKLHNPNAKQLDDKQLRYYAKSAGLEDHRLSKKRPAGDNVTVGKIRTYKKLRLLTVVDAMPSKLHKQCEPAAWKEAFQLTANASGASDDV